MFSSTLVYKVWSTCQGNAHDAPIGGFSLK